MSLFAVGSRSGNGTDLRRPGVRDLLGTIGYTDLHHQFILSSGGSSPIAGWRRLPSGGFCLLTHPSLPVMSVLDNKANEVGHVLGWPIDGSGRLVQTHI